MVKVCYCWGGHFVPTPCNRDCDSPAVSGTLGFTETWQAQWLAEYFNLILSEERNGAIKALSSSSSSPPVGVGLPHGQTTNIAKNGKRKLCIDKAFYWKKCWLISTAATATTTRLTTTTFAATATGLATAALTALIPHEPLVQHVVEEIVPQCVIRYVGHFQRTASTTCLLLFFCEAVLTCNGQACWTF